MNLIVAVDQEWGIGYRGDLLARIRGDLQNLAGLTTGKVVVLGSNTLATFPGGRVLKNRTNIVLCPDPAYGPEGATVAHSLAELFEILKQVRSEEIYVLGGASVYRQLLPHCQKAYVTKFDWTYEKDVSIPDLDADPAWKLTFVSAPQYSMPEDRIGCADAPLKYYFTEYERV